MVRALASLLVILAQLYILLLPGDSTYVSNAAIFLEYALTRSKHNYQFRLMLIRLYRLLGSSFVFHYLPYPNWSVVLQLRQVLRWSIIGH